MNEWTDQAWITKDGMELDDPMNMCGNKVLEYNPEPDNDWVVDNTNAVYSPVSKVLQGAFSRRFMGSSMNDIALRIDYAYEYQIMFGTFGGIDKAELTAKKLKSGSLSPVEDEEGNPTNIMTILPTTIETTLPEPKVEGEEKALSALRLRIASVISSMTVIISLLLNL